MNPRILIVEDDVNLGEALDDTLSLSGYQSELAENAELALQIINKSKPDIIVSDINMPGMDGYSLLKTLKKNYPDLPILLMTAYGNINDAVQAMRDGATDYLLKPFEPGDLLKKIQAYVPQTNEEELQPIAEDPSSQRLLSLAKRVAQSDASVLISGDSGTGKEVLARYIHDNSERVKKPFVAINCAAIPENMLEATLFGYEKGAFTGAYKSHAGKFEQAQEGTLLLDEISEMDLGLQAKLLRVIQERELERLGGQKTISLDVRIVATTNRDLREEVKAGRFREDLFYRLNVFPLHWIPLRERPLDIIPLAEYLLTIHTANTGRAVPTLTEGAKQALLNHVWSGNAREMDNVIQRALILQPSENIEADDIQLEAANHGSTASNNKANDSTEESLGGELKDKEYAIILEALKEANGNRKLVSEKLGISPRTLRYKLAKMREIGIDIPCRNRLLSEARQSLPVKVVYAGV